ncbi:MAG: hypothetical protein WCW16_03125 [Candidatus Magasanikbacteria bacterium]
MRKLRTYGIILSIFVLSIFTPFTTQAQTTETGQVIADEDKIEYTLFHLETCPHCRDEIKFLDKKVMPKYGQYIDLNLYEVSSPENQEVFQQYGFFFKTDVGGVPMAFIDGQIVQGYASDKTTGKQILAIVERKLAEKGFIEKPENNETNTTTTSETNPNCSVEDGGANCISIPIIGTIDPKSFSLPLLTVVLGLLDGFNPCAMWALLFLISLLLGMEDKRRMWLLGSLFILASGIVYFIFMAAWLQLILFIGMIFVIRVIIGLAGILIGGKNLWDFWKNRKTDGVVCKVSKNDGTKKTFDKIKDIVYRKNLWWSILGILLLGFSVNLVELACSAGFPAIFTQVLALNDLPSWERYLYMVGYIIFYMLDDMVVFLIAMFTLKSKMVGGKYAKYGNLIGGLLMLILGLLLIFKPEWLMFS